MPSTSASKTEMSILVRISSAIIGFLENLFYRHGVFIATRPLLVMIIMFSLSFLASLGYLNFTMEGLPENLWMPKDSDYVSTKRWQKENFPDMLRNELLLYESPTNILTPEGIRQMHEMRSKLSRISITDEKGRNHTEEDLCYRVPALGGKMKEKLEMIKKDMSEESSDKYFDWSIKLENDIYCDFFNKMPTACLYLGILDMWPYDDEVIEKLTQRDILNMINTAKESATFRIRLNFKEYLGGIEKNETGFITGAKSAFSIRTMENIIVSSTGNKKEHLSGMMLKQANEQVYKWEKEFLDSTLQENEMSNLTILPQAVRSFGEISGDTIYGDVRYLICGIILLCFYVFFMLGKCNFVEIRPVLTFACMLSILLAINFSYGLCSAFGLIYSPIHSMLPLLLVGLGVDDTFVIVQSFNNLAESQNALAYLPEIPIRIGQAMKKAGVAITVTSMTDFLAFAIGSSSTLPALRSFCVYAAVGIISLYMMQITFLLAAFTLDQLRMEASRNGFLWFVKHRNFEPSSCSQKNFSAYFLRNIYAEFLLKMPVKIIVLIITTIFTAVAIWGALSLKQEFNIILFIPKSTYLSKFLLTFQQYYPEQGDIGYVYLGPADYKDNIPQLLKLVDELEQKEHIRSVNAWVKPLVEYTFNASKTNLKSTNLTEEEFSNALGKFLYSPRGLPFMSDFHFNETIECGSKAPPILTSRLVYKHTRIDDRDTQIQAMDEVKSLVKKSDFEGERHVIAYPYATWESNKIIKSEVVQNLCLALVAVFIMTTILIANILSSLLVLVNVALTLVDVMALMHWWGLTIDTVTCIHLVLSIGLSVDYAAHIAVHFMKVTGTRNTRVQKTLVEVGAPVFHGAFSTFLAFVFLANSDSYVFESFFKVFFGVFIFGVYHGLMFLPVVLSLIGPDAYVIYHTTADTLQQKGDESVYYFEPGLQELKTIFNQNS